jgi:hypothetical protein
MVFIKYLKQGTTLLIGFSRDMKYFSKFQNIHYGVQCIYGIAWERYYRCIDNFGHEQYPSNNIDPYVQPWCLIIKYPNDGINFFVGFSVVM